MRWLDGIAISMDMNLQTLGYSGGQGSLVCCSPWGCKESYTTEQLHFSYPKLGRTPGEGNGNPSSIPAWEIPWTEGPGGLQSEECRHDLATKQ